MALLFAAALHSDDVTVLTGDVVKMQEGFSLTFDEILWRPECHNADNVWRWVVVGTFNTKEQAEAFGVWVLEQRCQSDAWGCLPTDSLKYLDHDSETMRAAIESQGMVKYLGESVANGLKAIMAARG